MAYKKSQFSNNYPTSIRSATFNSRLEMPLASPTSLYSSSLSKRSSKFSTLPDSTTTNGYISDFASKGLTPSTYRPQYSRNSYKPDYSLTCGYTSDYNHSGYNSASGYASDAYYSKKYSPKSYEFQRTTLRPTTNYTSSQIPTSYSKIGRTYDLDRPRRSVNTFIPDTTPIYTSRNFRLRQTRVVKRDSTSSESTAARTTKEKINKAPADFTTTDDSAGEDFSPNEDQARNKKQRETKPNNISRTNSGIIKLNNKKTTPPPVPNNNKKLETKKDFRKSVLNMATAPEAQKTTKISKSSSNKNLANIKKSPSPGMKSKMTSTTSSDDEETTTEIDGGKSTSGTGSSTVTTSSSESKKTNNKINLNKIGWRDKAAVMASLKKNKSTESVNKLVKSNSKVEITKKTSNKRNNKFIGQVTDIDKLLNNECATFDELERRFSNDTRMTNVNSHSFENGGIYIGKWRDIDEMLGPPPPKPFQFSRSSTVILNSSGNRVHVVHSPTSSDTDDDSTDQEGLDDCTLQIYKANGTKGDGTYLDLESTINEQGEDFEGFNDNRKNSILLRTQLSVRVHSIIEKLLNSEGKELRRALFSLKQIFQDDKDLVHEFVQNNGLASLIKVGSEADQNYQNYILRALGQVMLYVDGMNGVINHPETVQWFYLLIVSKYRLVVKTAIKLLLVFVEYTETNCSLLVKTIRNFDVNRGAKPWSNIMQLLGEKDSSDMELLVFAATLINKTLNGIPDQDTYYDVVDALEEQGMERIIQKYMSKQGTDLDLLQQFHIYEAVLKHEDGEDDGRLLQMEAQVRQIPRSRKSNENDRRKSWRHFSTSHVTSSYRAKPSSASTLEESKMKEAHKQWTEKPVGTQLNGYSTDSADLNGVTPALRRRRERQDRQQMFIKEQEETVQKRSSLTEPITRQKSRDSDSDKSKDNRHQSRVLSMLHTKSAEDDAKDEKLENGYAKEEKVVSPPIDMAARINHLNSNLNGIVSKAKEGLINQRRSSDEVKSPTPLSPPITTEPKKEHDLQWEQLMASLNRPLIITDLDFTDLVAEDDVNVFHMNFKESKPMMMTNGHSIGPPPPPPPGCSAPPPPPPTLLRGIPPPPNGPASGIPLAVNKTIKKNKKTIKLFWKDVQPDPLVQNHVKRTLWDELKATSIDVQKLEHLFENRAKDVMTKDRNAEHNKTKEVIVLDPKRSNAINIGMTKLPPPRTIKTAILKMDNTIMNREGIEKIVTTMIPTEEEKSRIAEAQVANPDIPLGSAEQFLLTLASISELPARLKLWAFKLDYEQMEMEVAEPLMDLKHCINLLYSNRTFRYILSTLLSIGNFLNGVEAKGFQIDYLAKVPEVKDTVHKHSLLHHLCHMVMEKYSDSTDLYSEIGPVTRASKVDFDELAANLNKMESECKASWDRLKLIAKHDGTSSVKVIKISEFLADRAERIIVLGIIHRRVLNRFYRLLCYLGVPSVVAKETKVNQFLKVISEFSLEYSTTRERVLQQIEKKANHRERNKTRGKMITDMEKFKSKDVQADEELRQLLVSGMSDTEEGKRNSLLRSRNTPSRSSGIYRPRGNSLKGEDSLTDGDDEILGLAAKAVAKSTSRATPRERKRARQADRKSLRRTLKNGLMEDEKLYLASMNRTP